ncbi:MAG: exosome complex exonuclease Rrp41 [Candidatus Thermoplasmatota archaeon]|jgi:exosome complex component RRP41|nr:exosome complex exonuclease Rrp41 [Candidatus Thermoplasmatota archaeon]MCL5791328.1 exosome complex exonuclease Rrp41 [Candidatus Thermoplasmatota archaeon]
MGTPSNIKLIDENGLRLDGRGDEELRPIKITTDVLERADGSAFIEWGGNKILVAVYGPREAYPKHTQDIEKAVIKARYNMAAFSVDERKRPGPDRRSVEISKVISEALSAAVMLEQFPRTQIDVFIEVIQADAGTRIASLTAASVALANAGVPMKDLVVGCTAGKVEGRIVLDLSKEEDNFGNADLPMAVLSKNDEVVLIQMDGELTKEELNKGMEMILKATKRINEIQRKALSEKYAVSATEGGE